MVKFSMENRDPVALLKTIAELSQNFKADKRAEVTLHGANGKSWVGIPTKILESESGQFIFLTEQDTERICYVMLSQIVAVEFGKISILNSYFAKPWPQNIKYSSLSKLQAVREMESLSESFNGSQFKLDFETLPARVDAVEDAVTWATVLRSTLQKMCSNPTAKDAINQIQVFEIKFHPNGMKAQKQGSTLMFQIDLSPECFNQRNIEGLLNSVL